MSNLKEQGRRDGGNKTDVEGTSIEILRHDGKMKYVGQTTTFHKADWTKLQHSARLAGVEKDTAVQGGPRGQTVEAEAEDAHGPGDVRGAVCVARQPARILDLQGRELHGRRFVHGALAWWISDGFGGSSPCVGYTSRALALMFGCEGAIGQKRGRNTEKTPLHRSHLTPTPEDVGSFACWSDADGLQVLCGTHRLHDLTSVVFLAR